MHRNIYTPRLTPFIRFSTEFLLKFRFKQERAEGPMEHIAQGKRSYTLGFPHSRVSTPCKGKSLNTHTPRRILRRMIKQDVRDGYVT